MVHAKVGDALLCSQCLLDKAPNPVVLCPKCRSSKGLLVQKISSYKEWDMTSYVDDAAWVKCQECDFEGIYDLHFELWVENNMPKS